MDRRIHFLDQVRSHMMLLGIVLHAAGSYSNLPAGELWPYKATEVSLAYSGLINIIHSFRMQVFFVVAGLFAAMLLSKRGNQGFLVNRTQRVLLPLLVFCGPIIAVCSYLFAHGAELMAERGTDIVFSDIFRFYHLWFLYYLYCYILAAIPLHWVLSRLFKEGRMSSFAKWLPWGLGLAVGGVHWLNGSYMLEAPAGLDVFKFVFFQYFLFFAAGMTAYHLKDAFFDSISSWWKLLLITLGAVVLFIVAASMGAANNPDDPNAVVWYGALLLGLYYAFVSWFVLAIYKRLCDHFSRTARYLSEASYWIYLVHLPFTFLIPMMIDSWPVHHAVKFGFVIIATFLICLFSYQLLVRSTPIGWLLNGKRHPFYLPFIWKSAKFKESEVVG